ncbi:MAG: hypothetical protein IPO92_18060 [Saprospiraceae bacterium]|nr:hypothetical protein [Saprospiraceae bacterium]
MKPWFLLLLCPVILATSCQQKYNKTTKVTFSVSIPDSLSEGVADGRMILMLSTNEKVEPRFEILDGPKTQLAFGKNLEAWNKGEKVIFQEMNLVIRLPTCMTSLPETIMSRPYYTNMKRLNYPTDTL